MTSEALLDPEVPSLDKVRPGSVLAPRPSVRAEAKAASRRLASLDAFRGLTILGMLLVNNIALDVHTPSELLHAEWNEGVHLADLVFPWFLLIVGAAIPFAAGSHRRKGLPQWRYHLKALGRAVTLLLLGCLLDSSIAKRPTFGLGVLQLIGLGYFAAALLYLLPAVPRLTMAALLLTTHWAAIKFIPVPGVGAGVFTSDQNLVNYVTRIYLEPLHLRGLVSVVPASALVLIGTGLGDLLRREDLASSRKTIGLLGAGVAMVVVGVLWNLSLPFNKPVWTASYVVFSAGLGSLLLGALYAIVDGRGWRALAFPFVFPGANAIFAYVVPILVKVYVLQGWTVPGAGSSLTLQQAFMAYLISHAGRIGGGWLYTLTYIVSWWLVLLVLYRKHIFLRV